MNVTQVIMEILEKQGLNKARLANRLGITRPTIGERLRRGNPRTDNCIEMLNVLDYKLVAVPSTTRVQSDWYEITAEKEKSEPKSTDNSSDDNKKREVRH